MGSRIEFQGYDMFKPQPVKGAAFTFLSAVMHDWADGPCLVILRHARKAMKKGYSRLLISDFVLPATGATLASVSLDLLMMVSNTFSFLLVSWSTMFSTASTPKVDARRLHALIDRQHVSPSGLSGQDGADGSFEE